MTTDEQNLENSLKQLHGTVRKSLDAHGFSAPWLIEQARLSRSGKRSNTVQGDIAPLGVDDLVNLPEKGSARFEELHALGSEALRQGQCALAVLAGGMATRMGSVIKALVPATAGRTFLELRLAEQTFLAAKYGTTPPLWLMTSHATHEGIEAALGNVPNSQSLGLFRQGLAVRLDENGGIFRDDEGQPSLYAPGHGDFADSLQRSGLLRQFVENGGKYVLATNLDNLGGGLDPVLVGMHIASECAVTCEVVDKDPGDRGGIPARLSGRPVILEEFRLPQSFDATTVSVFNVNTFAFDASALLNLEMEWSFFEVKKEVQGRKAVQYERLINEVTFHLDTQYVRVPRRGAESRFLPVKDHDELRARQSDLNALAAARGMIPANK